MQLADLDAHRLAQPRVKIQKRLVEEEGLGIAHDGAAHGNALPLAAGQRPGTAVEQLGQAQSCRGLGDRLSNARLGLATDLKRVAHVPGNVEMRVEGIGLEHHGDVAVARRHVVHQRPADAKLPAGQILQAGDDAPERGLAAARRPDEHSELAVPDGERDVLEHIDRAEALVQAGDLDPGHAPPSRGSQADQLALAHPVVGQVLERHQARVRRIADGGDDVAGDRALVERIGAPRRTVGPDHGLYAGIIDNLGSLLVAAGSLQEAEWCCREALAIAPRKYGSQSGNVARRLRDLGKVLDVARPAPRGGAVIRSAQRYPPKRPALLTGVWWRRAS